MTTEEAQAAYEEAGSVLAYAHATGVSQSKAYSFLRDHGVRFKKRGGATRVGKARKYARVVCQQQARPCVIHDIPGSCSVCERRAQDTAGIVSMLSVMECVRT